MDEQLQQQQEEHSCAADWKPKLKIVLYVLLVIAYHVYLGFAVNENWRLCDSYCEGAKLLVLVTVLVYAAVFYYVLLKPITEKWLDGNSYVPITSQLIRDVWSKGFVKKGFYCLLLIAVLTFYVIDTSRNRQRLISLSGIAFIIIVGFIFSKHRKQVEWRHLAWSLAIQFAMALIVLRWPIGQEFFLCISDKIEQFLSYADAGSVFVFDFLSNGNITSITNITLHGNNSTNETIPQDAFYSALIETSFAFRVLPVILYFSFVISILFYYGIMQRIVILIGWLLQISIGTTAAESVNAAASVFVGMTEAPLMIRPYMERLTLSELHAVMAGGFATISGTVFAAYISFGIEGIYLLSGAVMSAPIALGLSKLIYPETEESTTTFANINIEKGEEKNALEAAANGIFVGVNMACGIAASLISFIAFIAFVNGVISWAGSLVGMDFMSLEWILGKAFIPLSVMMGVEWKDCDAVGTLLGIKTVVNEFVAYKRLSGMRNELSPRSYAIATYALCSFSNIGSLGSQIGILGAMTPARKGDLATVGFRALCTGAAACFMTACMAGSIIDI